MAHCSVLLSLSPSFPPSLSLSLIPPSWFPMKTEERSSPLSLPHLPPSPSHSFSFISVAAFDSFFSPRFSLAASQLFCSVTKMAVEAFGSCKLPKQPRSSFDRLHSVVDSAATAAVPPRCIVFIFWVFFLFLLLLRAASSGLRHRCHSKT